MTDRNGIFAGDNPMEILRRWLEEAGREELNDPNAMTLATVDADGLPNARTVLLKDVEDDSLVFYTNYGSKKAEELDEAGKAALLFHWKSIRRQIRLRGKVTREDGPLADQYFSSRALESRIGAWASKQSTPLESRAELIDRVDDLRAELGTDPSRPPFWGGYRLQPQEIEFWSDGEFRLHDRFRWTRTESSQRWLVMRLSP
ncbi:MAG: pyridoxamine 5'-phosphate oxidase [Pseudomonadota bacterium]